MWHDVVWWEFTNVAKKSAFIFRVGKFSEDGDKNRKVACPS
jgi:hypothetical protein